MTDRFAYPVDLMDDMDGRVVATFPDLQGSSTDGADRAEALAEAADCLEECLAECIVDRRDIPPPSPAKGRPVVGPGALISAKAALYLSMREAKLTNVALAKRIGCHEGEVRRLLDPRHASKIGRLEEALAALGKRLVVELRGAA